MTVLRKTFQHEQGIQARTTSVEQVSTRRRGKRIISLLIKSLLGGCTRTCKGRLPIIASNKLSGLSNLVQRKSLSTLRRAVRQTILLASSSSLKTSSFRVRGATSTSHPIALRRVRGLFVDRILHRGGNGLALYTRRLSVDQRALCGGVQGCNL